MPDRSHEGNDVVRAARTAFSGASRILLAVSGGVDSMVLLHAAAALPRNRRPVFLVASFDHATGVAARRALDLVRRRANQLDIPFVAGRADKAATSEHEWRVARWAFLREQASIIGAPIATAHTLDDQIETVFMRILRDAGPRGLAALYAETEIIRPFLSLRRTDIARYAEENHVAFADDPTNAMRNHLRNRVRHDLLPAISRIRPAFPSQLLSIARKSAEWRMRMTQIADSIEIERRADGSLRVARAALRGYDAESLRTLWPSIAAKSDIVMDRRGTHRLAEFTMKGVTGGSIQLSGGVEVRMFRDHLLVRRWDWRRVEAARAARLSATAPRDAHLERM
ncbi:MAG TPA: tRNA lysidine(34) synthetase TilS [Gemmatimonadaceae bacterium]|jgi:tRNA(Ile)-lysidine synthase|nr:tRNA lysidine(34) synthetase TilS [Gemmatimonadaceae bacterium]